MPLALRLRRLLLPALSAGALLGASPKLLAESEDPLETWIGKTDNIVRARQVGPFSAEHNAWLTLEVVEKYKGDIDPAVRWKDGLIHVQQGERGVNLSPGQECLLSFNDHRLPVGRYDYHEGLALIKDGKLEFHHTWEPTETFTLDQFKKIVADENARHALLPPIVDWLAKATWHLLGSYQQNPGSALHEAQAEAAAWDRIILGPAPFLAEPPSFHSGSLGPGVVCEFIRNRYAKPLPDFYITQTRDWWAGSIYLGRTFSKEAAEASLASTFGRKIRVHWNEDPLLTKGHIEFVDLPTKADSAETRLPLWLSSLDCVLLDGRVIIYAPKRWKVDSSQPLQSDLAGNAHWWTK